MCCEYVTAHAKTWLRPHLSYLYSFCPFSIVQLLPCIRFNSLVASCHNHSLIIVSMLASWDPLLLVLWLAFLATCEASLPSINTTSGIILGHPAPHAPKVVEYLGVPYAAPPIGDLRFMPPVQLDSTGTVIASASYPDCPQTPPKTLEYPGHTPQFDDIIKNFTSQTGNAQSEDCLALDIWAPVSPGRKAVLVWFHGGRFSIGGSNSILYNGQYLAHAEDVIIVSVKLVISSCHCSFSCTSTKVPTRSRFHIHIMLLQNTNSTPSAPASPFSATQGTPPSLPSTQASLINVKLSSGRTPTSRPSAVTLTASRSLVSPQEALW